GAPTYLTAGQVEGWRGDAELVFLSACDSAIGPPRYAGGMPGLQRAFLRAGARVLPAVAAYADGPVRLGPMSPARVTAQAVTHEHQQMAPPRGARRSRRHRDQQAAAAQPAPPLRAAVRILEARGPGARVDRRRADRGGLRRQHCA